jgi:hypothetical protein
MDVDFDTTSQVDSELYGTFAHLDGSKSQFADDDWEAFLNDTTMLHFDDPMQLHKDSSSQPMKEEPGSAKQRFSQPVKSILDKFFAREPYPSKNATKNLAEETGLSIKQVKTWFTNKRSRTEPPSLPLSVSNVQMIPEADRVNVTTVLAPSVMAIPTRGSSRSSRSSRLTRSSLKRLEKEGADTCQISETRAYSLYALHRYFEDALDFEEIVLKYAAGTMKTSSPTQQENGAVAVVTSDNYVAKCPFAPFGSPSKNQVEGGSTKCSDSSAVSSGRGQVRSTKRRKVEQFYCTDFPPCQESFTQSVNLEIHIEMHKLEFQQESRQRILKKLDRLMQTSKRNKKLEEENAMLRPRLSHAVPAMAETLSKSRPHYSQENKRANSDFTCPQFPGTGLKLNTTSLTECRTKIDPDSRSVAGSIGSRGSVRSVSSYKSVCSTSSRRGRRRWHQSFSMPEPNVVSVTPQKPTSGRDFRCTFCGKRFSSRYEWNRHEESVHVPQTCWICARPECADKPDNERSFFRKDHLIQHLRRTHKLLESDINSLPSLDEWKSSTAPLDPFDQALHCGFCGHRSTSWSERVDHIANHVKNGADWNTWAKDRSPSWDNWKGRPEHEGTFSPTSPMSLKQPNLSSLFDMRMPTPSPSKISRFSWPRTELDTLDNSGFLVYLE